MKQVLFRCDASLLIGSGHVIRCRNLAREIKRRGGEPTFICRQQKGDLIRLLQEEFTVIKLRERELLNKKSEKRVGLYKDWLGCSQKKDAMECIDNLYAQSISKVDWIVADHYGIDRDWEIIMHEEFNKTSPTKLMAIDDLANRKHHTDIILDQNYFGRNTEKRYEKLTPQKCKKYLGPKYALLGAEYKYFSKLMPPRDKLHRLLVYYGGIDLGDMNALTLRALSAKELKHLEVDLVVGIQTSHNQRVIDSLRNRANTKIHKNKPSLAGLIARADLAIGAGGSTTWERACLGLPSVIIPLSENQLGFNKNLSDDGYISLIRQEEGNLEERIKEIMIKLSKSPELVRKQSIACAELVDGHGAERIARAML